MKSATNSASAVSHLAAGKIYILASLEVTSSPSFWMNINEKKIKLNYKLNVPVIQHGRQGPYQEWLQTTY